MAEEGTQQVQEPVESAAQDTASQESTQDQQAQTAQKEENLMDSTLLGSEPEPAESAPEQAKAEPASEAPEAYTAFTDVNGQEYAPESVQQFTEAAKSAGLSQEKAQALFQAMVPTAREHMMNDLRSKAQQWAKDCEKDPEIGGASFGANKAVAISAYQHFATPELRAILNASGLGNHPEVVRHFYRLGKTMQQDTGVHGGASSAPEQRRRYPNSNMVVDE